MTNEQKQLLLTNLCARLPYGVEIICEASPRSLTLSAHMLSEIIKDNNELQWKPYLRPMSSMSEEEKKELSARYNFTVRNEKIQIRYHSEGYWDDTECPTEEYLWLFDWLNKHHFDYIGLIKKELALEAPEDMYKND